MSEDRKQTIAKIQKLYNLAEGERKLGNDAASQTVRTMADKLKIKYSVTEVEIKGGDFTYKQTTSTAQNKNYKSAQEAADDIFADIFGHKKYKQESQYSSEYGSGKQYGYNSYKEPPKTYRYKQAFSYSAQHRESVKRMITHMIVISGADIESYETDIKEKSFFGNPKILTTRFSVTGSEEELARFKKIFLAWMANEI